MKKDSLTKFIESLHQIWGPLNSELVMKSQALMQELISTPISEPWLAELHSNLKETRELHRDREHGFILLAYTEDEGQYREPHNHGNGWVIYAVLSGEVEMRTYRRIEYMEGKTEVSLQKTEQLKAGKSQIYLPGDIHDTKCISNSALILRLTSCDLKEETRSGRMMKFK